MKPGRELDAEVAIHVTEQIKWNVGDYQGIPPYSTDISAAWTVDKPGWLWNFQETSQTLTVTLYTSPEMLQKSIRYYPIVPKETIWIRHEWLEDKAATYAWLRCLAALEAVGVETGS